MEFRHLDRTGRPGLLPRGDEAHNEKICAAHHLQQFPARLSLAPVSSHDLQIPLDPRSGQIQPHQHCQEGVQAVGDERHRIRRHRHPRLAGSQRAQGCQASPEVRRRQSRASKNNSGLGGTDYRLRENRTISRLDESTGKMGYEISQGRLQATDESLVLCAGGKINRVMDADLKKMCRPSDSFLTWIFARSISIRLTPLVAKTSITPMQVTLLGLFIGLIAAWQASKAGWPNHLTAALLLELSHVLDCIDGELARLTGRGNPFAAALDPITDRIKDIFVIYAAFVQSMNHTIFDWPDSTIFGLAFFTIGFWLLYMYIVDAYLNPTRKKLSEGGQKLYIGLYDLFVYGAIIFLVTNSFEYFSVFMLIVSLIGVPIQLCRLHSFLNVK